MLTLRVRTVLAAACAALFVPTGAFAAKATSCAKVSLCYCMNDAHKIAIDSRLERLLQLLAEQRKAGKAIDYLSGPLSPAGGGNFDVNKEVAESFMQAASSTTARVSLRRR